MNFNDPKKDSELNHPHQKKNATEAARKAWINKSKDLLHEVYHALNKTTRVPSVTTSVPDIET